MDAEDEEEEEGNEAAKGKRVVSFEVNQESDSALFLLRIVHFFLNVLAARLM